MNKFIRSLCVGVIAFMALVIAPTYGEQVWPKFRGPNGDGITKTTNLPVTWSPSKNITWRTKLPGNGWSSPVASRDRIYLTTAIEQNGDKEFRLALLILNAKTGELMKTVEVFKQTPDKPARIHKKNSHASPTPVLDSDRIFVHFGYQGTACLSTNGEHLWSNRDLYFKPTHGNGGTPILVDNRLIFTCDGDKEPKIVALDTETGEVVWKTRRPVNAKKTFSFCTPTLIEVAGTKQVIAPGSDCVLALDPKNGNIIWDVRYTGYSVVPKPVYDSGLVYVSTSFDRSKLLAIRPNGQGSVTDSHVVWQATKNIPKTPSMLAFDGLVYSISDDGIALCTDGNTGEVVYRKRIGGNFSASPLLAGDRIYYTSEEGVTTVIRTGRMFEEIAENDLDERTLASLAVLGDSLLLRTEKTLYRISD